MKFETEKMMKSLIFSNGDKMPLLGLGTWLSKSNEAYQAVLTAISLGYRHIDSAYIYRNEKEIGRALQFALKEGLVRREDLFITSKLWNSDHAPERVEIAIQKSLTDLQLDYLDLYLIHWPVAFKTNHEMANDVSDLVSLNEMPISNTWQAMEEVRSKGLARHIGVSNFNVPKLKSLIASSVFKPEVNQVELHPYFQQTELVQFCQENGMLVTAFSPLGSRHLMNTEVGIIYHKTIVEMAENHNCTPSQVLLCWGMQRGTSVIPKSIHPDRIKENFEAIYISLNDNEMKEIKKLEKNLRVAKGAAAVFPNGSYTYQSIWDE